MYVCMYVCGFPKIRDTFLVVPIIRTIIFWAYIGVLLFRETTISRYGNRTTIHMSEGWA